MMYETKSGSDLINELEEAKKTILELKAALNENKQSKKDYIKNEKFIFQVALELVELSSKVNLYEFTAYKLKELFEDSIILVTLYEEEANLFKVAAIEGLNHSITKSLKKLLGEDFMSSKHSLAELRTDLRIQIFKRELRLIEPGLYTVSGGIFPKKVCSATEKILGVTGVYGIGLNWNNKLYGTVAIFMKGEDALKKKETIETFINMVSVAMQRRNSENEIKKALKEKEMLLKEIHHRVKNNLMVISSLLNLQSHYIKDKSALEIFKESQNRAKSMALIHERLYKSNDLKRIDFGDYLRTLTIDLYNAYVINPGLIKLNMNIEEVMIDVNTAVPLGLIVNELITNAMKHAFPLKESVESLNNTFAILDENWEIKLDFHTNDEEYILRVSDNGIGFPDDLDLKNTSSLGLRLVNSLTEQIRGDISLYRDNGTHFQIKFREIYGK